MTMFESPYALSNKYKGPLEPLLFFILHLHLQQTPQTIKPTEDSQTH
jgi:hypothetical protein